MIILSGSTNFAYFDNQIYKKFNYIFFFKIIYPKLKTEIHIKNLFP